MRHAKQHGYRVDLAFVILTSLELHLERVRQRVARGGHDIPEATVRRRYSTSLTRLPAAIRLADECVIFDNSTNDLAVLARLSAGLVIEQALDVSKPTHARLIEILSEVSSP